MFPAFMPVKSLSIPSGMLSLCRTLIRRDISVSNNDSSSPHLLCTVTDKRLLNIAVSIYCLSVCSPLPPPIFHHAFLTNSKRKKKKPSLFVNWPGSGERIVAKCTASRLSLTFRLFCSAFYQQTKKKNNNPAKADKAEPLPVCLSVTQMFYLSLASVQTQEKNHRVVCVHDYSAFFLCLQRAHLILSELPKYLLAPKSVTLSAK